MLEVTSDDDTSLGLGVISMSIEFMPASKDYGRKPVEDAIKSEISSLITDTGALEACRTTGQQLPLHLNLGHKFDAHGKYSKTKAHIVIGGNL